MRPVKATLYVIPGSHPAMAARLMLERKGIPYKRVDLAPALHKPILRALRFGDDTVPALKLDGRKVIGSRRIARELDALQPEPPLFPADPGRRRAVEEAERWGDEVFQPPARRLIWWATRTNPAGTRDFLQGARLGIPDSVALRTLPAIARVAVRYNRATDDATRADLAALPGWLDHVDELIAEGVIGERDPNAADFQIGTCVRILMLFDDLRPAIEGRPAAELGLGIAPHYPGRVEPVFPAAWLEPLRSSAAATA